MAKGKLTPETRQAVFEAGWQVLSLYQPPWAFPHDGRKLKQCAESSDPWIATLFNGASILTATRQVHGQGASADAAVLDALKDAGTTVKEALSRLETAVDGLIGAMR